MRFAEASVSAANTGRKAVVELEFLELSMDAVAIAAGDQSQSMAASELRKDAASSWQQLGIVSSVMEAPDLVGGVPFGAREIGGAIDVVPVGGVVLLEFGDSPGDIHFAEHGEVGSGVSGIGVEQGAVPVEEDAAEGSCC
jgi:hypothetical protein